jgi:ketosteroid isomerase-like protein
MSKLGLFVVLPLFIPMYVTVAQQKQRSSPENELIRIEQTLAKAWVDRDRASIEKILAPEWSVTDGRGQVLSRDAVMRDAFDSGSRVVEFMQIDDVRVRLYGSTAVVTGRTNASGRVDGRQVKTRLRFTDVFVKTSTGWRAVASHASEIRESR